MGLSARQLSSVITEISSDLTGGMIRKIYQPSRQTILFEIEKNRKRHLLLFSAHPQFSRCHLILNKIEGPKTPPNFCQLLRARLRHKRIDSIKQWNEDRILHISAKWPNDDQISATFVAELTGMTSNFFLLDNKETILGFLKIPPPSRNQAQGQLYQAPSFKISGKLKEAPVHPSNDGPYPLNQAIETLYGRLEKQEDETRKKKEILTQIERSIRQCKKKEVRLQSRYTEAQKSIQYQRYGEFLKSRLHEIKPGTTQLMVDHRFSGTNTNAIETVVQLDPDLSPVENMNRFFKRYKKGQSTLINLTPLIENNHKRLKQLETERKQWLDNTNIDFPSLPSNPLYVKPNRGKTPKGPPVYLSSNDLHIIVGRSRHENEEITFGMARGNDLWLHARGVSGSHVLIQLAGRKEAPYPTLLDAAQLALHFSQYKKEGRGEVMYTYKKYVKRPKNGKAGSVICSQEKTIYLEINTNRLNKILENRLKTHQK